MKCFLAQSACMLHNKSKQSYFPFEKEKEKILTVIVEA